MNNQTKKILVTGAAGYLASWIVKQLIEQGHIVHGTVRNLEDENKIKHLIAFVNETPKQLKLFKSDLLQEGSFDEAMQNCDIVIHTASPYFLEKPQDIQSELINPAVQGTQNILNSVNKNHSVKRVVLTSSVVSLFNDAKDLANRAGQMVQEQDVNQNQDKTHNSYAYSKTKAELLAWTVQKKQKHWDLITIHPGAIFGPSLSSRVDATSIDMMIKFLNGSFKSGVPKLCLGLVDVRDVAQAHLQAAINGKEGKRYIAVCQSLSLLEIAQLLDVDKFGIINRLPKKEVPKFLIWLLAPLLGMTRKYIANNVNYLVYFNHNPSKIDLNIQYLDPRQTLNDHIGQLVTDNLI